MSKLHCLNVGKADCFLLELREEETEGGRRQEARYVLIDGGSKLDKGIRPPEYLKKKGVRRLDAMILTHLHQDHQGWLLEIARSVPVERAVLPYPPVPLGEKELAGIGDEERVEDIRTYNRLWKTLKKKGCLVETTLPRTISSFFVGEYELRCLYPFADTASRVYPMLCRLQMERPERIQAMYDSVRTLFNQDSSVWLLRKKERPLALFCGDAFHSSLAAAVGGCGLQVPVIKLSHHGRNDKGNLYFQDLLIRGLRPEIVIITADEALAAQHMDEWRGIDSRAQLLITGLCRESAELTL